MGMDGLSIANTGMVKEATSAEFASKTEQAIQSNSAMQAEQVQGLSDNQVVHRKDEEDEETEGKKKNEQDTLEDTFVASESETDDVDSDFEIEDIDNQNKDFYVKLNVKDDIIELYDSSSDRLIETISGNELGELVQRLNMASGIFVNKKV